MLVYDNKDINLQVYSLENDRWEDFVQLFGEKGACGGCWCMSWRLKKSDFEKQKGEENKNSMKNLVNQKKPVGVLAYKGGKPIGWCAVAPRTEYIRLKYSRVLKKIDEEPVWSITCLFISKEYRRNGLSSEIIKAAINYCKQNGAEIIEAYPTVPYENKVPDPFLWTGIPVSFEEAGFKVVEKRSKWKIMMRYYVK